MNKTGRIIVVTVLALAVAGVLVVKHRKRSHLAWRVGSLPKGLPLLVDLGAGKCTACKMMEDVVEGLEQEFAGSLRVRMIDVSEVPEAKQEYGIRMIPTQIFYDAVGKELFRHEGFMGRTAILEKWEELGIRIGDGASERAGSSGDD